MEATKELHADEVEGLHNPEESQTEVSSAKNSLADALKELSDEEFEECIESLRESSGAANSESVLGLIEESRNRPNIELATKTYLLGELVSFRLREMKKEYLSTYLKLHPHLFLASLLFNECLKDSVASVQIDMGQLSETLDLMANLDNSGSA